MGFKNSTINKVLLLGNVVEDCQYDVQRRYFKFKLVTEEKIIKGSDFQIHKEYHTVAIQGALGSMAKKALKIGDLIYIEGKVITNRYRDSDNIQRYDVEIIANYFEALD